MTKRLQTPSESRRVINECSIITGRSSSSLLPSVLVASPPPPPPPPRGAASSALQQMAPCPPSSKTRVSLIIFIKSKRLHLTSVDIDPGPYVLCTVSGFICRLLLLEKDPMSDLDSADPIKRCE